MKTYLITGGCGFIGSNFIHYMFKKYGDAITIINLDKLTYAGNIDNLSDVSENNNYVFIRGDICDAELCQSIFKKYDISRVVHFAAESHVDRSIFSSKEFILSNVWGTTVLLDAAKKSWICSDGSYVDDVKYLQVSTDEVYGSLGQTGYFTETTPINPHSPYSASKAAADMIVKSYFDTHGMPVNITRCSNNYGPYQYPEKLIPLLVMNCLEKKSLPIYGDGLNIRDWLYVADHCRAIDLVLENGVTGDIYNIGGHNERTNIDIVKLVIEYLHENYDRSIDESLIKYIPDRKGHDRRYAIDSSKIQRELGWLPQTDFTTGLSNTITWYLENQLWLLHIMNKK